MKLLQSKPMTAIARETDEEPARVKRVCFVCTGNTCRSPMAAAVANALAQEPLRRLPESIRALSTPEVEAFSAGLDAREGDPIAENAIRALEAAGIEPVAGHDYRTHTAHTLVSEEAERYDLLIGLTREHSFAMLMQLPHLAQRIVCMPEDIPDPFGGGEETYRVCLERITHAVKALLFPTATEN